MKKKISMSIICIFIISISFSLSAQELLPSSTTGEIIKHSYYTLSYSEDHEQAEWVYYELTPELINGTVSCTYNFRHDRKVSAKSAHISDYKGSGFDIGHLCPAGDMKLNRTSMSESFLMSNMSPQVPSFNRGIWKGLESLIRDWVAVEGKLYVVTGPIFNRSKGSIGSNEVTIPRYFYKVVYAPSDKKMIGFVLPNEKNTDRLQNFSMDVDLIELLSGIDFYPSLEDSLENKLESVANIDDWQFMSSSSVNYLEINDN